MHTVDPGYSNLEKMMLQLQALLPQEKQKDLVAIVQFGSTAHPPIRNETDVDLLLVFENLPSHRWERYELFTGFEKAVEQELAQLKPFDLQLTLSPLYKTRAEYFKWSGLYLDFEFAHKVIFEKGNAVEELLQKVKAWKSKNGAYRVQKGLKWYWVYSADRSKPVELKL